MSPLEFPALAKVDPAVHGMVLREKTREMDGLELIPSENVPSKAVLEALGSYPQNKYAEGYPHKRYYGGNEVIDEIEDLAIERAKKLFGAEHANVQPYSGSPGNEAVYFALLDFKDTFMGLKLPAGGHLTHGHDVNFSGKYYNAVQYDLDQDTEVLNYDAVEEMAREVKPKLITAGYTAYPRAIDFKRFREIADAVGAYMVADISHISGFCATGLHQNPVKEGFDAVMTTTHKLLRGPRGAIILCKEELGKEIDKAVFPGLQGGPHEHQIAAKAVCFGEALKPEYKNYCAKVKENCAALGDALKGRGYRLVSGGSDTHLQLVDTMKAGVTGKEAEAALEKAGIYCNKNTIPHDPRKPWDPSGIRVGTPVLTSRGFGKAEMAEVAELMHQALQAKDDENALKNMKNRVKELCERFPYY